MIDFRVVVIAGFLFVVALLSWPSTVFAEQWDHVDQIDGVDIYERDAQVLGDVAFRGVTEVDVHIGEIIPVFVSAEERSHWVYELADQRPLDRPDEQGLAWSERYWARIDMPFPTTDRDFVFHADYEIHPDERVVTAELRSVDDDRMQPQACCVRAESITRYRLEAVAGQPRTRLEVAVETDLGGRIPGWISRQAREEWPVETLNGLVERAREADLEVDDRVEDWHDELRGDASFPFLFGGVR